MVGANMAGIAGASGEGDNTAGFRSLVPDETLVVAEESGKHRIRERVTPASVELLFDVRFLPNPYFEETLREGTGRHEAVADYVMKSERGESFFRRLDEFIEYLLPFYDEEGKAYVTIGVGCTGGRHRSVAIAEAMGVRLRERGREVSVTHRDVERPL